MGPEKRQRESNPGSPRSPPPPSKRPALAVSRSGNALPSFMNLADIESAITDATGEILPYDLIHVIGGYTLYPAFEYRIDKLEQNLRKVTSQSFERYGRACHILFYPFGNHYDTFAIYLGIDRSLENSQSRQAGFQLAMELSILHPTDSLKTWTRRVSIKWGKDMDDTGFNKYDTGNVPHCFGYTYLREYRHTDGTLRIRANVENDDFHLFAALIHGDHAITTNVTPGASARPP